jgi:heterotetrameric sarcosine oxidase gamma subunit
MHLVGAGAAEVLARYCPLDLRTERFGIGQTARAPLADMPAIITPIAQGFEIMVLQSLSRTAVHHLHQAMLSLAAQASLI